MKTVVMKRVCGWCGKNMGVIQAEVQETSGHQEHVTHGMCDDCVEKELDEEEVSA